MKVENKKIAFGLTNVFFAFEKVIAEMKKIQKYGGEIIPIMSKDTYTTDSKYYKSIDFIKDIEECSNRKIITVEKEAEEVEADILVIAPCCR